MAPHRMPRAEVDVTSELVRALLAEQHPDLLAGGDEPVRFANGWDNVMFRLGDDLTVRVPRRRMAARLIEHEQVALSVLADRLPLDVPTPVRHGGPSAALGYPWSWSVAPWLPGGIVANATLADPAADADALGRFFAALHRQAPDDAPANPYRGGFIGDNTAVNVQRVADLGDLGSRLLERWHQLVDGVAPWPHPPVWIHGDLHTANVLAVAPSGGGDVSSPDTSSGASISAVIDWGDVCGGDPATDLAVAWMLFDESDRSRLRTAAGAAPFGVDDDTWRRAEAWALHFAIVYLAHSADNATMTAIGRRLVHALLG